MSGTSKSHIFIRRLFISYNLRYMYNDRFSRQGRKGGVGEAESTAYQKKKKKDQRKSGGETGITQGRNQSGQR